MPTGRTYTPKHRHFVSLFAAASSLVAQNPAPSPAPPQARVAVKAAHLIDPRGQGRRIDDAVVLINSDTVVQVGSKLAIPSGYIVVDLGPATLLPGLIDVHTHLTSPQTDYYEGLFRRSPIDVAITAPANAKRTLDAGFTRCATGAPVRGRRAPERHSA